DRVVPEFVDVVIGMFHHGGIAAAKMQRAGARNGELGKRPRARTQEGEIADMDRLGPPNLAADDRPRLRGAAGPDVATVDLVGNDVAKPTVEVAVIGASAELAVSGQLEADALLQPDRLLDRRVLGGGERRIIDFASGPTPAHLGETRRPQQAADVLGAERRG